VVRDGEAQARYVSSTSTCCGATVQAAGHHRAYRAHYQSMELQMELAHANISLRSRPACGSSSRRTSRTCAPCCGFWRTPATNSPFPAVALTARGGGKGGNSNVARLGKAGGAFDAGDAARARLGKLLPDRGRDWQRDRPVLGPIEARNSRTTTRRGHSSVRAGVLREARRS